MGDHAGSPNVSEFSFALPILPVRITKLDPSQITLIRQAHVDAHDAVTELHNGAFGQVEVGDRPAIGTEMYFCRWVRLVRATIPTCFSVRRDKRGIEISPAGSGLAAQRAIALVNEGRLFFGLDTNLAAMARQL